MWEGYALATQVDLSQYLPNVNRSKTDNLQTASGELFTFTWGGQFWAHTYTQPDASLTDWWQWTQFPGDGESLFYFFGDYTYPSVHIFWGEAPAIQLPPRYWDDAVPVSIGPVSYVGTQMHMSGSDWVFISGHNNTATTTVQQAVLNGEAVIYVNMTEIDLAIGGPGCSYEYYLSTSISTGPLPWQKDKGIRRFVVACGGQIVKDMTFVKWVHR